jgi:hypothetical protein
MKKRVHILFAAALAAALALGPLAVKLKAQDPDQNQGFDRDEDHSEFRGFVPDSIVLSGTVYVGKADTIIPGEVLPPGCLNRADYEPQCRDIQCADFDR